MPVCFTPDQIKALESYAKKKGMLNYNQDYRRNYRIYLTIELELFFIVENFKYILIKLY